MLDEIMDRFVTKNNTVKVRVLIEEYTTIVSSWKDVGPSNCWVDKFLCKSLYTVYVLTSTVLWNSHNKY